MHSNPENQCSIIVDSVGIIVLIVEVNSIVMYAFWIMSFVIVYYIEVTCLL